MAKKSYKAAVEKGCTVFYFTSLQEYLVNRAAEAVIAELKKDDAEITVLDGPKPDVDEMVASAGTISFFAQKRLIYVRNFSPSAVSEKDMKDIQSLIEEAENSVLLFTSAFADSKAQNGKKNQAFAAFCAQKGIYENLIEPGEGELAEELCERAAALNTELSKQDALLLVARCSKNQILLENELDKLAAASGYSTITGALIGEMTGESLEENAFKISESLMQGRVADACMICSELLNKKEKAPVIWGAVSGNFVDAYRMARGEKAAKSIDSVGRDFHYTGKFSYRLQKAKAAASKYKAQKLRQVIRVLLDTDIRLKSSGTDDLLKLETGICEISEILKK